MKRFSRSILSGVMALSFGAIALTGCGGSTSVGIPYNGTYTGSFKLSSPPKTTTGSFVFTSNSLDFSGSWVDGTTTRSITGVGTSESDLQIAVDTSTGTRTFTGALSLSSASHLIGTFTENSGSATITVDMTTS